MIEISLCMIVKDEEKVLGRCLDSVAHLVEEIIILDAGSSDKTKDIAKNYTEKIYDFKWIDNFAVARNKSFSYATKDYIFWLDADDILTEDAQKQLVELKKTLEKDVDFVSMIYNLAFDEYGNVSFFLRRNRLVKRNRNFKWHGYVHEYLEVYGKGYHSDVAITHESSGGFSDRNLRIYEKMLENNEEFTPRDLYYYGNELFDHRKYSKAIQVYKRFLDDNKGWIEDNIACCGKMADCYYHLGDEEKAMSSILRSLRYDGPRAEFCNRIGNYFLSKDNYLTAIFWYKLATQIKQGKYHLGFSNPAYSTWVPHLQLCVCFSRLGAYKLAYLHNEAARHYRPDDLSILHNKSFLEEVLKKQENE
ncbi:MAG: glycosyltransferase family 2 protein [Bacillota bacterium]|nr:glycosyltransferase family 2 protein [Bacillota bacterium]